MTMPRSPRQPMPRIYDLRELAGISRRLRRRVIEMIAPLGQGYVQQGLGAADIFCALYFSELRLDPRDPAWDERDRLVLSTAHNTAIFYATLAERELLPAVRLEDYCRDGSPLEMNASERVGPVVEATCGSLGQGLSVGAGMALSARRRQRATRVFVILGDGELQEGQVWEAALFSATHKLSNLCAVVDYNRMQVEGDVADVAPLDPLAAKWESFGWNVIEVDGHDMAQLISALANAREQADQPTCIVAHTVPGKGVPAVEGILAHNLLISPELAQSALDALDALEPDRDS